MKVATGFEDRTYILPITESSDMLVARVYRHSSTRQIHVLFSVVHEPAGGGFHLFGLPSPLTQQQLEEVVTGKSSLEHAEEVVTRTFFDTLLESKEARNIILGLYPHWATNLLHYLHERIDEIKSEYYFRLDSRLS